MKAPSIRKPGVRAALTGTVATLLLAISQPSRTDEASDAIQRSRQNEVALPLPTDEQMTGHFKSHQAQFEELVRLYQSGDRWEWRWQKGSLTPFPVARYQSLLKETQLLGLSNDGSLWLPDPYSRDLPARAKGIDAIHAYQYHGIVFSTRPDMYRKVLSRLALHVSKAYLFVPAVPMIDSDQLWWPRSRYEGDLYRKARVAESLDRLPQEWMSDSSRKYKGECVYKRIETQWFLSLCNLY
jgi:hypothetical protein